MSDSRYWKLLAALFTAGVFYLAHGLHDSAPTGALPSLTQELHAGDVTIISKPNNSNVKIITSSDDGRTINVWTTTTSSNIPNFVGSVSAR